jgi:glycosyltransferase involved in cell wall biosynthesis
MYKKVIIFSGPYPIDSLGATKTIDLNLAKAMVEVGYDVTLIACGKCLIKNVNFIEIKVANSLSFFERVLNKIGFKKFNQLRRNNKVDSWVATYIKTHKSPIDTKSVFIGRAGMSKYSFAEVKKHGALTVLHSSWMHPFTQQTILHNEYNNLGLKSNPISKNRIARQLKEIEQVDKIWCISNLVYNSYLNNNVAKDKLFLIFLGVDFKHYTISDIEDELYPQRESSFKILFVGQVNYEKGAHLLLEALKNSALSDCEMIFNGSLGSNFNQKFYQYKEELEKKNIKVTLSPGDPSENYKQASIFVLPSIHESFGLVVLEAMASGLPVVISDGVGAKDCVIDQKTGFIFESHNIEQLKNKIEYFYFNRLEISTKGKNASSNAQKYIWKNTAQEFKKTIN